MKKFITISIIVAIGGIAFGVIRRHEPATTAVAADIEVTTATTVTAPPQAGELATTTTARKTAPKVTTTTQRATTTTVAKVAATTKPPLTLTTAPAPVPPRCTLTADSPSLPYGQTQRIRFTSDLPGALVTMTMRYPGDTDANTSRTGSTGDTVWTFISKAGLTTVTIAADVQPAGGQMQTGLCSTSYQGRTVRG